MWITEKHHRNGATTLYVVVDQNKIALENLGETKKTEIIKTTGLIKSEPTASLARSLIVYHKLFHLSRVKICRDIYLTICLTKNRGKLSGKALLKGDTSKASRYKEMASDELKHSSYLHEWAVNEINALSKTYTPPVEMQKRWDEAHAKCVEKAAWIRQMLAV